MKSKPLRVAEEFDAAIREIKRERIKRDMDKEMQTSQRLTLAFTRHRDFPLIKEDVIKGELKDDRKR